MPQAVNLVLKNAAAVDQTFALYNPSAGDDSWANWRLKVGAISSVFPKIAILARVTPNKARKAIIKLQIPSSYTDAVTGLTNVNSQFDAEVRITVPDDFPEAVKADAVAYLTNLMANAMVKEVVRDAVPPT